MKGSWEKSKKERKKERKKEKKKERKKEGKKERKEERKTERNLELPKTRDQISEEATTQIKYWRQKSTFAFVCLRAISIFFLYCILHFFPQEQWFSTGVPRNTRMQ